MSNRNNFRKCAKCGKARAEDMSVSYHRFPNPGIGNMKKASAWAKYCYPTEDWTSLEFLKSLHFKNKVLCGRHFHSSQFYDNMKQKLNKFAVPDSEEVEELLNDENLLDQSVQQKTVARSSKPLISIENITSGESMIEIQSLSTEQTFEAVASTSQASCSEQSIQQSNLSEPSKPLSSLEKTLLDKPMVEIQLPSTTHAYEAVASTSQASCSEQNPLVKLNIPVTKKKRGILRELNVTKIKELSSREVKLYNICQKKIRQVNRLRKQLKKKKVNIVEKLSEDENVQELYNLNISNSFIVFLQSQLQNCPKKPKGRRYSLDQKLMALVMYKKSPACYRLLRRMFTLPGQSCLNKLLNQVPLKPGINRHIFESLKKMSEKQTKEENICLLLFDEMSIRKHLFYDCKQDKILGFQDHGNHGRSPDIATKALVFMLAGLRKKWKQPIAFYFTHSITADRMTVILKEILSECANANVDVVATICDLSTVNIKVLKTLGTTTSEPYFEFKGREYVALLDPPHLLKCTRNLLLKHNVECTTDMQCNDVTVKGKVKWSHFESFYNLDKNNPKFVYAPALTDQHIYPNVKQQMRVKLAAQVFSHTVACGILSKIASNDLPMEAHATASFAEKFDNLFDAVNADSPDLRRGKKYSTNLTAHSPHIGLFNEMKFFISSMIYIGARGKPPSQNGWIQTLNGIQRLWQNVQKKNIKSISTRRLNQDALENCFGCIRYNCGSNYNPTISQFVAGIKTAIITNLRHAGQKKNCEDDSAVLDNNLKYFLTANFKEHQQQQQQQQQQQPESSDLDMEEMLDAIETVEEATSEIQACAYVSGFIFKKLRHNKCQNCQNAFLSQTQEAIHLFTSLREYDDYSRSLIYVNKDVVKCVEHCATIINNYLQNNVFEMQLKRNIMLALNCVDFSFLNKCENHIEQNSKHIKFCTFSICLKRYTILRNRDMEEDEKNKALQRKIKIVRNK